MKNNINIEIKNVRSIKEANIEINKINVIGGVNGSGKSTVSKIFYSFLKANSQDRMSYLHKNIMDSINHHIKYLIDEKIDEENIPDCVTLEDDYSTINKKYDEVLEIFKNHDGVMKIRREELSKDILDVFKKSINKLSENGVDVDNFQDCTSVNDIFNSDTLPYFQELMEENGLDELLDILMDLNSKMSKINYYNYHKESLEVPKKFIDYYFNEDDNSSVSEIIMKIILIKEHIRGLSINREKSENTINFFRDDDKKINAFDYYFENDFINQVFYIDNVSILDFEESNSKNMTLHKSELIDNLFIKDFKSTLNKEEIGDEFKNILNKIEEIINGEYLFEGHLFNTKIPFNKESGFISLSSSEDEEPTLAVMGDNISSGIKQIGIIQILLLNNKLKKDGFLILDEPEVNLHPKWQFKFAEILVLLAKDLNITLYINSHSPMFIEALDAFCDFYDIGEDINYYLTKKSEEKFKYDFIKINSNELYKIYDNLGSPYKLINQLKLRKRLNK